MARTIAEIKESMTADFMANADVARAYGFEAGDNFTAHFSKVSVESLLFYIVACAMWVLECMMDRYMADVEARIEEIIPHRPKWYRDKVLAFMKGLTLVPDTDQYDTTGMSDADIEAARVVRYAAAAESDDASMLVIKVAGEQDGIRGPLDAETEQQLLCYIAEIKDAGVRVSLVNQPADRFCCTVRVLYNAMLSADTVQARCASAVEDYVQNLPFNVEYSNMALVDVLQQVDGVRIVEVKSATAQAQGATEATAIDMRCTPAAGYFAAETITISTEAYQ